MVKFLICALFYGDHPSLARRCAASLKALCQTGRVDLRIGLNEVSAATQAVLDALLPGVEAIHADPQIYKFPMMHRLVHGYRGDATHLMWFDDDSCLHPGTEPSAWLGMVASRAAATTGSLGSVYSQRLTEAQKAWIRGQPWYRGLEVPDDVVFNTGGWLVVPLDVLRQWNWPGCGLQHNGGDMVLGELLRQQGRPVEQFRVGVAINADAQLRESAAPRRGFTEPAGAVWHDLNGP